MAGEEDGVDLLVRGLLQEAEVGVGGRVGWHHVAVVVDVEEGGDDEEGEQGAGEGERPGRPARGRLLGGHRRRRRRWLPPLLHLHLPLPLNRKEVTRRRRIQIANEPALMEFGLLNYTRKEGRGERRNKPRKAASKKKKKKKKGSCWMDGLNLLCASLGLVGFNLSW